MGVSILEGKKADRIANALEIIAIKEAGGIDSDLGHDGVSQLIKSGLGARALPVGSPYMYSKETSISATHSGTGITDITVNEETFINAEHESGTLAYEFTYDGAGWKDQNGNAIELSAYGIQITGTPEANDAIVIHETASVIANSVMDHDYDTPVDPAIKHTMTIAMDNCLENMQFDAPEALIACPEGLNAERYYVTSDHGAYDNSTTEDGVFGFTPSVTPSLIRYVRHSTMGAYRSSYAKSNVLNGKFITYDADFTKLEECATDEGSEGTSFGTVTAETSSYNVGDDVNYTRRNAHGSNDWETSNIRQRLNASGTGWWEQKTKFDFPPDDVATLKGFLTGIDPALKAHMQTVKKRYARHANDGGGYRDVEDKVFLLSQTEVNLGQNNSQYETSFGMDNTLKTVPYAYYNGATNADRIKILSASPRIWWLRGAYPSHCSIVRYVSTGGSLSYYNAYLALGLVAACVIG